MTEQQEGCVKPAKGIVDQQPSQIEREEKSVQGGFKVLAKVGKPAPDFEANAYVNGGFKNIKLSDYRGKWVVVCFYPGDFTFV